MSWPILGKTLPKWTGDCFMWGDLGGEWIHVSRVWPTNWDWWFKIWLEIKLGNFFSAETEDNWKVFSLSYTMVKYKSLKRASAKNWFLLKRASALATKTNTMVQWKYLIKEHQQKELRIPLKEHQHLKHNLSQNYGLGGWGGLEFKPE